MPCLSAISAACSFCYDTSGAEIRTGAARTAADIIGNLGHMRDESGIGIAVRIGVIETVDIAEVDEHIGIGEHGDICGESIVIAELYLLKRHCIVFVNDGHAAEREQLAYGVLNIAFARFIVDGAAGDEYLRNASAVIGEKALVYLHKLRLTDGCERLLFLDGIGLVGKAELCASCGDRTGRHENNIHSRTGEIGEHTCHAVYAAQVEMSVLVREGGGAYLDYYSL